MAPNDSKRVKVTNRSLRCLLVGLGVLVLGLAGCTSEGRAGVSCDPDAAAKLAIQLYDANHDGTLDGSELESCPALMNALWRIDEDGDRMLGPEEISNRIRMYQDYPPYVPAEVFLVSNGRPVPNLTVELQYEPFLSEATPKYSAATDQKGRALVSDQLSPEHVGMVPAGFYRIEIKEPNGESIATFGREIAFDSDNVRQIRLKVPQ